MMTVVTSRSGLIPYRSLLKYELLRGLCVGTTSWPKENSHETSPC